MVTIRKAILSDAAAIAGVYVETWRDTYAGIIPDRALVEMSRRRHAAMWAQDLGNGLKGQRVVVAEDALAGVVGFGSCGPARGTDLPYEGEVYTLYVLPDFQGTGIGKRLLARLFTILLENGSDSALVWVLADNPSRFFYQTMGGAFAAVRKERLWGATLSEMAYAWPDLKRAVAPSGPGSTP